MNRFMLATDIGTVLFISIFLLIIPIFTRRNIAFGVTIPESEKTKEPIKIWEKHYMIFVGIIAIVISIAMFISIFQSIDPSILIPASIILVLVVDSCAYLYYHRKVKLLKGTLGWMASTPNKVLVDTTIRRETTGFQLVWYIAYLLIIGLTVLVPAFRFDLLPAKLPIHFDLQGMADSTMIKEKAIFIMPATQIGLTVVLFLTHISINGGKVVIDPNEKEASAKRQSIFRKRMAMILYIIGLVSIGTLFVSQLFIVNIITNVMVIMVVPLIMILVIIVSIVIFVISTGQSGWKINRTKEPLNKIIRDDDKYYKLGVIYFNPRDPAIFVEKRFGIGWTFNFGNPISWGILLIIIVIIVISL